MNKRLSVHRHFPESFQLMKELDDQIRKSGIEPLQLELIKIRASQINGCVYCIDKHTADALKLGEDARRIYVLSNWKEVADWFSEEEQVVLQLTEEVTGIGRQGITDEVYNKALALFGEARLTFLIMAAVSINAWNRIGVGLHMRPVK